MATNVAFRESLLQLKMYLLNSRECQINFPLWLFSGHVQGPFSCKCHIVWFFYLTRDWSKDDVNAIQGLLMWDNFFCEINISMTHGKLHAFLQVALRQCCSIVVSIFQKSEDILIY